MVAFKRPDCIQHVLYNVECLLSTAPDWRKNVTFVSLRRNLALFKGMDVEKLAPHWWPWTILSGDRTSPVGVSENPDSHSVVNVAFLKDNSIRIVVLLHHIFVISPVGNALETLLTWRWREGGWGVGDCLMGIRGCDFFSGWWKWFGTEQTL